MSIIQEALVKAQAEVRPADQEPEVRPVAKEETANPPVRPAALKAPNRPLPAKNRIKPLVGAIALIIMVFAIFYAGLLSFKGYGEAGKTVTINAQEVTYRPIVRDGAEDGPAVGGPSQSSILAGMGAGPELVLNGIMYLEEGPRAIINNGIVMTGDLVSGAKVTNITRKNVVLEYEDVEITLNLK